MAVYDSSTENPASYNSETRVSIPGVGEVQLDEETTYEEAYQEAADALEHGGSVEWIRAKLERDL